MAGSFRAADSSFAGQIGQPANSGALADDVIGAGGVRVSPLGMALAAAVVDSGHWHAPSLVSRPCRSELDGTRNSQPAGASRAPIPDAGSRHYRVERCR